MTWGMVIVSFSFHCTHRKLVLSPHTSAPALSSLHGQRSCVGCDIVSCVVYALSMPGTGVLQ